MPPGENTPTKYDWHALYSEFHDAIRGNSMLSLNAWCQVKQLSYTNTSRQFAEISRLQTAEIGATLAPKAMKKLGALLDSKDAHLSQKTATAILDRTGHSPKEQVINVQTNVSLGIALFSGEDREKSREMFKDAIIEEVQPE